MLFQWKYPYFCVYCKSWFSYRISSLHVWYAEFWDHNVLIYFVFELMIKIFSLVCWIKYLVLCVPIVCFIFISGSVFNLFIILCKIWRPSDTVFSFYVICYSINKYLFHLDHFIFLFADFENAVDENAFPYCVNGASTTVYFSS